MSLHHTRLEVMKSLEASMDDILLKYLKPIEENWQPTDFLPDSTSETFYDEVKEFQELAKEMDYDLFVVLIGDCITEEALPTYESWLIDVEGIGKENKTGWTQWVRSWTAEENRHGDLLNKYLYLSGRVNMRELEITIQYLLNDGFDPMSGRDPYKNFVFTSFQEMATNISHRRVATLAKKTGNNRLAKMCGVIAADEARHASAYISFIKSIFELDPSEVMLAFEYMMRKKIIMPATNVRQSGGPKNTLFEHFSDAAQRAEVYTTQDYIDILKSLLKEWDIEHKGGLTPDAEKAQEYLIKLPQRLERISERIIVPQQQFKFKWVAD